MTKAGQTELFETIYDSSRGGIRTKTSFLDRYFLHLRFDQCLLVLILLTVSWVFLYSFGMEAGKRRIQGQLDEERLKNKQIVLELTRQIQYPPGSILTPRVSTYVAQQSFNFSDEESAVSIPAQRTELPREEPEKVLEGKYTIQLATYYTMREAEAQIKKLKERGMIGFVIPSGKYVQLCVNSFKNRETASSMLSQLKADRIAPSDAFVRNRPASL